MDRSEFWSNQQHHTGTIHMRRNCKWFSKGTLPHGPTVITYSETGGAHPPKDLGRYVFFAHYSQFLQFTRKISLLFLTFCHILLSLFKICERVKKNFKKIGISLTYRANCNTTPHPHSHSRDAILWILALHMNWTHPYKVQDEAAFNHILHTPVENNGCSN